MLRRIGIGLAVVLLLAVALPPLFFALRPAPAASLPPPGRRVALAADVGVNLLETGSGPPVVLVHGLPGSAYDWRPTPEALAARGRRVLAYDRVGYGHSDARPDDAFTLEGNARDLAALLEALDLQDATVVGWSYGGGTALVAAHRDASRIGRLVLVGSVGPGMEAREPPPGMALLGSAPVQAWVAAVPPVSRGLQAAISEIAFSGRGWPDWWLPTLAGNFARPHTRTTWGEEGRRIEARPAPPDPSGLAMPVLVVHGDDDRLVPLAVGRALTERAARGRLLVAEGGSHMLPVTRADWLADAIVAFEEDPP